MKLKSYHYLFPALCIALGLFSQYSGLDTWLVHFFYDSESMLWPYKSAWLTEDLLHRGARDGLAVFYLLLFLLSVVSLVFKKLSAYRRMLFYIFIASISAVLLVGWLKSITHMYTPWDLQIFGGAFPNIRLFDPIRSDLPVGHAFPAGHASGGYALLSIYFYAYLTRQPGAHYFLYAGLLIGMLTGFAQQMRGAHMISHDLFTLAICWLSSLIWSQIFMLRQTVSSPRPVLQRTAQPYSQIMRFPMRGALIDVSRRSRSFR